MAMDIDTLLADLQGFYGGSFTEAEAKHHLKKAHVDADTIEQVIEAARKQGLIK